MFQKNLVVWKPITLTLVFFPLLPKFQKNLVVWKPKGINVTSVSIVVSEELSSVETHFQNIVIATLEIVSEELSSVETVQSNFRETDHKP